MSVRRLFHLRKILNTLSEVHLSSTVLPVIQFEGTESFSFICFCQMKVLNQIEYLNQFYHPMYLKFTKFRNQITLISS